MLELVLGGARSGKSRYAQRCAEALSAQPFLVATALADDEEMAQRIALHRQQRGDHWQVVEASLDLVSALRPLDQPEAVVVVDCLTLWLSNLLHASPLQVDANCEALCELVAGWRGRLFLISNEVGSGIVPLGALSREFVDRSGWLHQALAQRAARVTLVVAGLPLRLKDDFND